TELWLSAPTTFAGEPDALIYPGIAEILDIDPEDTTLYLKRKYQDLMVEAKHRMVHTGRFKLVYEPSLTGYRLRLFDAHADPANTRDVSAEQPEAFTALSAELFRWMAQDPARKLDARGHVVRDSTYFQSRQRAGASTREATGITMRVNSMLASRPPITAIASGCCICAPGPRPNASGRSPRIAVRLVMRIGRKRARPASTSASSRVRPAAR